VRRFIVELVFVVVVVGVGVVAVNAASRAYFRRRKDDTMYSAAERVELERIVFPHLSPEERKLPWTLADLRELARMYEEHRRDQLAP
jgi:hypothetical protein